VPYTIFVERSEVEDYARHIQPSRIHVLPHENQGLTVTRNYIWDYAESCGHDWFWTFDDNISGLYRFNHNLKTPCADATVLAVVEDFAQRYENLAITGLNYFMFVKRKYVIPPYILNTRVYSNMLINTRARDRNGSPFRNVTFYNDDTDLCLRVLKAGYCTVLFNSFLIYKQTTMTVSGGMTDYYLDTDNRREFAEELVKAHPDCVQLTYKWGRWHHHVDYSRFRQQLKRREGVVIPRGVNNFGMVLQERIDGQWKNSNNRKESEHENVA
jgi:glycosyltransferase involved in cell wall biosynthesis